MSMAIGYGMSEQLLFDEKTGKPLNNNLLDYKLSTFMDHPHLEAQFVENPEPTSAFGTKALGEPPACSGAPAIRNAILNATGVAIDQNPMNAHILFRITRLRVDLTDQPNKNTQFSGARPVFRNAAARFVRSCADGFPVFPLACRADGFLTGADTDIGTDPVYACCAVRFRLVSNLGEEKALEMI